MLTFLLLTNDKENASNNIYKLSKLKVLWWSVEPQALKHQWNPITESSSVVIDFSTASTNHPDTVFRVTRLCGCQRLSRKGKTMRFKRLEFDVIHEISSNYL